MRFSQSMWIGARMGALGAVFLVMACETDVDSSGCAIAETQAVSGFRDGCGQGVRSTGDGSCVGDVFFGGDACGASSSCAASCAALGGCEDAPTYHYGGERVEGSLQVHLTASLFDFVRENLLAVLSAAGEELFSLDEDGRLHFCVEPRRVAGVVDVCAQADGCRRPGLAGEAGCLVSVRPGALHVEAVDDGRVRLRLDVEEIEATLPVALGPLRCDIDLYRRATGEVWVELGADLTVNPVDGNTELYIGGDRLEYERSGLGLGGSCAVDVLDDIGGIDFMMEQLASRLGALSCRGCETLADCGGGATSCDAGVCVDANGGFCQGVQLGVDARLDLTALLGDIDPGVEGGLGLHAFVGGAITTFGGGLQLGGHIGGAAVPESLCAPPRPSPLQPDLDDCRTGDRCPPFDALAVDGHVSDPQTGEQVPFHLGAALSMSGINQALWAAYSSGALCLSLAGDVPGLEAINTQLVLPFLNTMDSLMYGEERPMLLQLRPQQPPYVRFDSDPVQGAIVEVVVPELEMDVYTVVDERYARLFTMGADLRVPLSVYAERDELRFALGALDSIIVPGSTWVEHVDMVSRNQAKALVANLPALIASMTEVIDDSLIPPLALPSWLGVDLVFAGPGAIMIEEQGEAVALGLFFDLALSSDDDDAASGRALVPVVEQLQIEHRDPAVAGQRAAASREFGELPSYRDRMPRVHVTMGIEGSPALADDVEFATRVNGGLWSFWRAGTSFYVEHPSLAREGRMEVEIAARLPGDGRVFDDVARFAFVNDWTPPELSLEREGAYARVEVRDAVYAAEDLRVKARVDGGAWQDVSSDGRVALLGAPSRGAWTVEARAEDPRGNLARARRVFGQPATVSEGPVAAASSPSCTASVGGGAIGAAAALLLAVALRRRRV